MQFDLLIKGGRVIDPATGLDGQRDVAITNGRVAATEAAIDAEHATQVIDARDCIVTPGLVDLHSHVYWGGTSLGVDADRLAAKSGTTTFIDAGSAGAGNFLGFRRHVIERSKVRILAYVNISFAGIFGFSQTVSVGECSDLRLCDPREVVAAVREHADVVVGVKVRSGRHAGGTSGIAPVDLALEAADKAGMPLMAHIDEPPPTYEDVLVRLRPGDTLTHCFRPFPNSPITGQGAVKTAVLEARKRGVLFDVGHGMGSFSFKVARAMLDAGFMPDTISSDVHSLNLEGPVFDQATTLSKFLCLGTPLTDVIRATTANVATAIRRPELGTLRPGSAGDATIFTVGEGSFPYIDSTGERMNGNKRILVEGIALRGHWWHPAGNR